MIRRVYDDCDEKERSSALSELKTRVLGHVTEGEYGRVYVMTSSHLVTRLRGRGIVRLVEDDTGGRRRGETMFRFDHFMFEDYLAAVSVSKF